MKKPRKSEYKKYKEYFDAYFEKYRKGNKEKIKLISQKSAAKYYQKNREAILEKRKEKRDVLNTYGSLYYHSNKK